MGINNNLDLAHKLNTTGLSLEESVTDIEDSGSFIMVRSPEVDQQYKELYQHILVDVCKVTKDIDEVVKGSTLYLFISSPGSVTPFHIDRYSTFLLQAQGTKDVHVWERWDRKLITDEEMEQFISYTHDEAPRIKDSYMGTATINEISPGQGVHIPFVAPHWVKNGEEVSVSLSIIFNSKKTNQWMNAMRFNDQIRQSFGYKTTPVNKIAWKDNAKSIFYRGANKIQRIIGK